MAHIEFKEDGKPYIKNDWLIEDVVFACADMEVTLTEEEMEEVLYMVADGFDANHGICWENFYICIGQVDSRKEKK
tara:strand:+ start:653 stop:880 length:228 start_codon:yes stop_codon:yes gene_type:complete